MKRTTTFLLTLLLITLGASAQADYTWALSSGTWTGNSGTYGSGVEVYQTTAFESGKVLYCTVADLPAGEYELTFYAVASSTSNRDEITNDAYGDNIAQVYATAGGETQATDVEVIQQTACTQSDYPYTFTCTVGDDGLLEFGLQNIATGGNWYVCQGVSLTFSGEATTRELEPGDVVEEEPGDESSLSHYSLTYTGTGSNGGLDYNTWSGESGMTTPYHQVWVSSSLTLSDMTISHYEIPLMPAGTYTVTVDARVLSEADNAINTNSAFFCANDASVDIVAEATTDEEFTYGTATEHEVNGTYTLTATVGEDGILNIYFTIKDATYNWISWKNLKVVYEGGETVFEEKTVTYTDNLHVMLGSDDEGVQESTVDVEYTASDVINFTLHGLAVSTYNVGDVTVNGIQLEDAGDGVCTFSYSGTDVSVSGGDFDDLIRMVTITVNLTGEISEDKLRADMTVTVTMLGMSLLNVTADFGYSYEDYLVVNVESGYFLGGGLDWGTHATELGKPQFFTFGEQADGTYKLDSHQGGTSLGWDVDYAALYVDAVNPLTWTVTEVDGGYTISCDDGYLTGNGFQKEVTLMTTAGSTAVWKLVTKDEILASMDEATADNPVDVTALIPAPEPKRNNWGGSWVATGYGVSAEPANYSLGQDWNTANCAESWHSSNGFDIRQTIPSLPAGHYILNAQAFHDGRPSVVPVMYVDDKTAEIPLLTTSANDMESAYQEFLQELHTMSLEFDVEEDDTDVLVGFSSLMTGDNEIWTIFGELELLYCGTEVAEEPEPEDSDVVHECVAEESHWTTDGTTGIGLNTWSVEADASGMVVPFLQLWVWSGDTTQPSLEAATVSHETLTDLEPGAYEVSLDIRIFSEAGNEIGEGTTFNANGASADLLTEGETGTYATSDYPNMTEVYGTYTLTCEVGEDGVLDISINIPEGVDYNWIAWKNLSVTYVGEVEPEPEVSDVVHECEAEESHWTTDGTTGIGLNTWSVEADASGMVVPFLQLWVWSGDTTQPSLEAATVSHETLTDLEPGAYEVSLDIRIFSEAGNEIGEGTTFNANGASADLLTEGETGTYATSDYPNMTEVYGTYVLTATVGDDGVLDISINIPEGVDYNWIAWKNLSVTYVGEVEPEVTGTYVFVAEEWVASDDGRVTADNITYNDDNTITVVASGANNVALGNNPSQAWSADKRDDVTTANYTISKDQCNFVVIGSNLSTVAGDSYWWWMNGINDWSRNSGQIAPDEVYLLDDDQLMFVWDLTSDITNNMTADEDGLIALNGCTCFGLTSTTGTSVISDINFYTNDQVTAITGGTATLIESVETAGTELAKEGIYTLSGVRLNKITKSGIYIVDGKKVLVK